jgi:hypothetical protein
MYQVIIKQAPSSKMETPHWCGVIPDAGSYQENDVVACSACGQRYVKRLTRFVRGWTWSKLRWYHIKANRMIRQRANAYSDKPTMRLSS